MSEKAMLKCREKDKSISSIYISGGWTDSQLLWLIPLISMVAKQNNIRTVVSEKAIPLYVLRNECVDLELRKAGINIVDVRWGVGELMVLQKLGQILKTMINSNRRELLSRKDYRKTALNHTIWDLHSIYSSKWVERINIFSLAALKTLWIILRTEANVRFAVKNHVKIAFMSHGVYQGRYALARFPVQTKAYVYVSYSFYLHNHKLPGQGLYLDKLEYKDEVSQIKDVDVEMWFNKRLEGKGTYEDARLAWVVDSREQLRCREEAYDQDRHQNLIFLHVFHDSPFLTIDEYRVYADYYEWIYTTLELITMSTENWYIKLHPSATRWGEDQVRIVDMLIKKIGLRTMPDNVDILDGRYSNHEIFQKAKRLITFRGTASIEFACVGKKPILISETHFSRQNPNTVYLPRSHNAYKELLLTDKYDFTISAEQKIEAKKFLYWSEEKEQNHCAFCNGYIYRGDTTDTNKSDFLTTAHNLPEALIKLEDIAQKMHLGESDNCQHKKI